MHDPIVASVVVVVVASVAGSSLGFVNEIHALRFTGVTNNTAVDTIMRAGISPDIVGYRSRGEMNGRTGGWTGSEPASQPATGDVPRGTHEYNVADVCAVGTSRKRLLTREIIERAQRRLPRGDRGWVTSI